MKLPRKTYHEFFCPECGRTDRNSSLKENHFYNNKKCPGIPVLLVYKLDPQKALCESCGAIHAPGENTLCDK